MFPASWALVIYFCYSEVWYVEEVIVLTSSRLLRDFFFFNVILVIAFSKLYQINCLQIIN